MAFPSSPVSCTGSHKAGLVYVCTVSACSCMAICGAQLSSLAVAYIHVSSLLLPSAVHLRMWPAGTKAVWT